MATVTLWVLILTNTSNGNVSTQIFPTQSACTSIAATIMLRKHSTVSAECEQVK
jgi:hypothetical protein